MTLLPLDSRQARIARLLLDAPSQTSLDALASELRLTPRIVRYNLPPVEAFLARHGMGLTRRRGAGVWLEGTVGARDAARADLDERVGPAVLDAADRQVRVLLALLEAAPDAVRSETLEVRLGVSRPTIRRDVRAAEAWLEQHRLHIRRLPGVGLAVRGSEVEVRAGLLALVLEQVPANVLTTYATEAAAPGSIEGAAGLRAYLVSLGLPTFRAILAAELPDADDREPTMLTATLALGIQSARIRAGRPARLVRGRLRSLLDHPVSDAARRIAAAIAEAGELGAPLAAAEIAAITESLLGFAELSDRPARPPASVSALVDRLIAAAAGQLHPALLDDQLLRDNLVEHLRRLHVRLRYGLPVSNPLQDEVRRRYPDVWTVATEAVAELGSLDGESIPAEEIGLLTMYLAGSLERHRLRPKLRVTVVCPAGMATAWILVSRLAAEFPQLEVARVLSKAVFEHDGDGGTTDIVITTVPLEGTPPGIPTLVVSPLLEARDVRRIGRALGVAARH